MKNSIKCCISCILPCGILDVIRIVHSNGQVEELSHTITASEVMKANPKHILRKASTDGVVPKIVMVPPEAELQRGKIYFLMPVSSLPQRNKSGSTSKRKKKREIENNQTTVTASAAAASKLLVSESDNYLSEILSEKVSTQRDRRRGRVGVWRPHLESISESTQD